MRSPQTRALYLIQEFPSVNILFVPYCLFKALQEYIISCVGFFFIFFGQRIPGKHHKELQVRRCDPTAVYIFLLWTQFSVGTFIFLPSSSYLICLFLGTWFFSKFVSIPSLLQCLLHWLIIAVSPGHSILIFLRYSLTSHISFDTVFI